MQKQFVVPVAALLVCMSVQSSAAQAPADAQVEPWKAAWITAADAPQRDEVVLHFRKAIELSAPPQHFVVQVSADNQFLFFVNGQRVGSGPSHGDLGYWRYETYDLAPFLHAGKNLLGATVWNFGVHAAVNQMSDRAAFLVHGNSEAESATDTNESWEVEREYGISTLISTTGPWYFAAGPGERLECAKFDKDWQSLENSAKSNWSKPVTLGRGALRGERDAPNNWQLLPDPLPPMEMKEIPNATVVRVSDLSFGMQFPAAFPATVTIPASTKVSVLLDQGALTTAYPALDVSGGAGSTVVLTYSEALYDEKGEKGNRDEIGGKHIAGVRDEFLPDGTAGNEFTPLGWRTWRYLQLDIQTAGQPLEIRGLRTWFSAYPFEERGYFHSGDDALAKIWQIGWRTARLDAHDTYMDTPYWERLQYIGDTRIQALISYAVAGDDRLARQAIDAFNHSRIPEGLTQSRYPSALLQMIPTFSLLWIGMVHDFWMYRGDGDLVRAQLPGTRTVLDWYLRRQRSDGLLGRICWWPFVDWGKDFADGEPPQEKDGGSAVITLQFIEALRYAAEMETVYGDPLLAENYRTAATRAAEGVRRLCWNEKYGLLADTPAQQHFSQHANILGVWLDVLAHDQQRAVVNKILSASDTGFTANGPVPPMTVATYYFRFYLARAAEHAGMGDRYLELLAPWREMVGLGLTTWAESPEPTRSDSHAWSAHPNFDLLTIVAGIHPASPGFATVRLEPHLGARTHIEAGMPTPKGMVQVKYERSGRALEASVTLPEGVGGEILWGGQGTALHAGAQTVRLEENGAQ